MVAIHGISHNVVTIPSAPMRLQSVATGCKCFTIKMLSYSTSIIVFIVLTLFFKMLFYRYLLNKGIDLDLKLTQR